MAQPDEAALKSLLPLLRQLRDIKGLREVKPSMFQLKGSALIQFQDEAGVLSAELRRASGTGFERHAVDTPAAQRRFVEEAKRRVSRSEDD